MSVLDSLIGVIAPHHCVGCNAEGALLCANCADALPAVPSRCYRCMAATSDFRTCARCRSASPIHSLWATTVYGGAAKDLVHRLKFERAQAAAAVIAQSLAARLPERQDWLVTFVPTAPTRRRQRGYDQAELIARRLARQIGAPYAPLLGRGGKLRQVGQGRAVRKEQMQGAFYARRSADGRHVLVVDDVVTTGGTLEATAAVLRDAGAARVSAVVFAAA